ncbi:membrane protein [Mycoplasmopsis mustelae]|uniref:Membrane protein n=1 Tax=Mycoplasmopsis mustelae TaxID=171289 RepID=A0A4R7UEZ6_9BACT|nr:YhjD/YihY/BrkB family envelope integrity protein [Mycoplasmopsis mustelae]TDV24195.1 membrane protein [Mycoplasmopsis mustelae]
MKNLKNKTLTYKKMLKMRVPKSIYKKYYLNIIQYSTFVFFTKLYEKIILGIISIFAHFLIRASSQSQKAKRKKVVLNVFEKFWANDYNFVWLSTAFYMLISFVSVIYIVNFLNISINDNIHAFTNYVSPFYQNAVANGNASESVFQSLFNITIFNKFIPGSDLYFSPQNNVIVNSTLNKLYSLIPGSFVAIPSLYIAAGGYGKLITSFNVIYSHERIGTYWGNKVKGLFLVIVVSVILWGLSTIHIFVQARVFISHSLIDSAFNDFLYILFTIIFFVLTFLFLFKLTPSFKLNFNSIYRGMIISTTPTVLLVIIYTYLNKLFSYSKYGAAVGFFFSIGFFVNWYVYFMFLGIIFNNAYYKSYISTRTMPKRIHAWLF